MEAGSTQWREGALHAPHPTPPTTPKPRKSPRPGVLRRSVAHKNTHLLLLGTALAFALFRGALRRLRGMR